VNFALNLSSIKETTRANRIDGVTVISDPVYDSNTGDYNAVCVTKGSKYTFKAYAKPSSAGVRSDMRRR